MVKSAIAAALLSLAAGLFAMPSASAQIVDTQAYAGPTNGPLAFTIADAMGSDRSSLAMQPSGVGLGETRGDWVNCLSVDDPACDVTVEGLSGKAIFPPCTSPTQENCVVSLRVGTSKEELGVSTLIREADQGITIPASEKYHWIYGGNPSLWDSEVEHQGGAKTYAVAVSVGQYFNRKEGRFHVNYMQAAVVPYTEDQGPEYEPYKVDLTLPPGEQIVNGGGGINGCVWREAGKCGVPQEFTPKTVVELEVRLPSEIGGWFQGRFKDPVMSVEDFSKTNVTLKIAAESIETPTLRASRQIENLSAEEYFWYQNNGSGGSRFGYESSMAPGDPRVFKYVESFRKELGDTIARKSSIWMLGTTFYSNGGGGCYSDKKIQGIVSTDAMGYDSNAPEFDSGYLNYRVTGLHYETDGITPVVGSYDLILDSEVARCMYGYSKAPISATVQVVGTGDQNIATTIVSEKDGWLKLAAYGFTFSEKEIQVKLTQPQNKTLTKFAGSTRTLTSKQMTEIKAVVTKAKGNPKFICTGVYANAKDKVTALKRARAACDYAKSLDKNHSYWAQAKQTKAKSYDGKVMIVSK